jgi:AcrR family transcriptional regulator
VTTESGQTEDLFAASAPAASLGLEEPYRALTQAAVELSREHGAREVTSALLADRAGVPLARVEELFESPDACLRLAAAEAGERLSAPVRATVLGEEWLASVHAAIAGFCAAVAADPARAELAFLEGERLGFAPREDPRNLAARDLETLLSGIPDERRSVPARVRPFVDEFHACGVLASVTQKLQLGRSAELPAFARELSALIGCFYLPRPEVDRILSAA